MLKSGMDEQTHFWERIDCPWTFLIQILFCFIPSSIWDQRCTIIILWKYFWTKNTPRL